MRYDDPNYNADDFYDEPTEFEEKLKELKKSLATAIKDKYKSEMERLKSENAQLQRVKRDWVSIQNEYAAKSRQLEYEREKLEQKVRRERLDSLLADLRIIRFRAVTERVLPPKCDKCNDKREIEYLTPLGKKAKENCDCSVGKLVYKPQEYVVSEYGTDHNGKRLQIWYKHGRFEDSDHDIFDSGLSYFCRTIYKDGMDYEGLNSLDTFFDSREDCQTYCDWLNQKMEEIIHG